MESYMKSIEHLKTELALWETRKGHLITSMTLAPYQIKDIELEIAKVNKALDDAKTTEEIT